jgi:hypothetical protein
MVYKWKIPIYKVPAQEAGEHIESLIEKNGEVTPKMLVDDARPEDALLHPCFEWNDQKAAEQYRRDQAKNMISNLVTVSVKEESPHPQAPAFVNVRERNESATYICTTVALSNEKTKEQVLKNAKMELDMFRRKYETLIDVSKLLEDYLLNLSA